MAAATGVAALATASFGAPNLNRMTPIVLRSGVNHIAHFAPDGRDARIVRAWRDSGNAHGYELYLVLMPTKRGSADWNVVGFETGKEFSDEIVYAPHTGEDVARAVRFVWALDRGRRIPVVVAASREIVTSYADPSVTTIKIFSLRKSDGGPETNDFFGITKEWTAKKRYCNAELALRDELGLNLPADYAGPNTVNGCP